MAELTGTTTIHPDYRSFGQGSGLGYSKRRIRRRQGFLPSYYFCCLCHLGHG